MLRGELDSYMQNMEQACWLMPGPQQPACQPVIYVNLLENITKLLFWNSSIMYSGNFFNQAVQV